MSFKIGRIIKETEENIKNDKSMFISTIITLSIIFLMANIFWALVVNLKNLNDYVKSNMQIKVYLEKGITTDGVEELERQIWKYNEIKSLKYVPKEIALNQMSKSLGIDLDYSDNPLPDVIMVVLNDDINIDKMREKLMREPGVSEVEAKGEFIKKIIRFAKSINTMMFYMYFIISLPVFILVYNLIHLTIVYRREEIEIMTLVGASRHYIKAPFILEGIVSVFLSAIFSVGMFSLVYRFLKNEMENALPILNIASLNDILPSIFIFVFVFGIIITSAASYLSIKRYLKVYGD